MIPKRHTFLHSQTEQTLLQKQLIGQRRRHIKTFKLCPQTRDGLFLRDFSDSIIIKTQHNCRMCLLLQTGHLSGDSNGDCAFLLLQKRCPKPLLLQQSPHLDLP
ncbi:hypothetical protein RND81_03G134300 [Saponaria officinalis]|uniref:Uncharacterized protein n=1 Tax=Saponaria officinalis TaxID=3572 RepID=A0AAW1M7V7_SAPOF